LKNIFSFADGRSTAQVPLSQRLGANYKTIFAGYALIALITALHARHPHLMTLPLYLVPCGMIGLKISRRWGAFATAVAAAVLPVVEAMHGPSYDSIPLLFWNCLMRFFTLWIILILFERVSGGVGETEKAVA